MTSTSSQPHCLPTARRFWPTDGADAFRLQKLLAAAAHRATKLAAYGDREGEAWVDYFTRHFPPGRRTQADAKLLWTDWRTALLKTDSPGPGVAVTHGQPHAHWMREDGRLVLNLEDMWDDFASSVESLIAQLRESLKRTEIVLNRWHRSRTEVRQFGVNTTASASASVVVVPPPGA
jgi:hypothetical protein